MTTQGRSLRVVLVAVAACGGQTSAGTIASDAAAPEASPYGAEGGTSSGGADSGAAVPDAGPSPCPSVLPAAETACAPLGLRCEYGDQVAFVCDAIATCQSSGWNVAPPAETCPTGACPATYAAAAGAASCATENLVCPFAAGYCACSSGPVPPPSTPSWHCFPAAAGCPAVRPLLGAACVTEGLDCDYGACFGGDDEACEGGLWVLGDEVCPP